MHSDTFLPATQVAKYVDSNENTVVLKINSEAGYISINSHYGRCGQQKSK